MTDEPLVTPLTGDEWGDEQFAAFAKFIGVEPEKLPEAGSGRRLDPLNFPMVGLMVRAPALAGAWWQFNRYLLFESTFPPRLRELAILRISKHYQSAYEWTEHVKIALANGITEDEIALVAKGNDGFSGNDLLSLQTTDQLLSNGKADEATWNALVESYGMPHAMELLYIVGSYQLLSQLFGTWQLQPPPDSPPIP